MHRSIVCRRNVALAAWTLALALSALAAACGRGPAWTDGASALRTSIDVERPDPLMAPPEGEQAVGTIVLSVDAVELEHRWGGWSTLEPDVEQIDLLRDDAMPAELASGEIPDGTYDRMRILVSEAEIEIDGEVHPLHIAGSEVSGPFCVGEDPTRPQEVVLVWDLGVGLRQDAQFGYVLDSAMEPLETRSCSGDAT